MAICKENFEKHIGKEIQNVYWKDGSITECNKSIELYLGIVNGNISVCKEESLWTKEIKYVDKIEFKKEYK